MHFPDIISFVRPSGHYNNITGINSQTDEEWKIITWTWESATPSATPGQVTYITVNLGMVHIALHEFNDIIL